SLRLVLVFFIFFFLFFFQAEDGIRDFHVTGVQTCALPISPYVKFILATTDPQKLPATILSRCLQFSLKNMSPERVVEHLSHVLKIGRASGREREEEWVVAHA